MRPVTFSKEKILESFYQQKVLTKEQVLKISGCSNMTAWRMLKTLGYISSYNFNAKYYTLADIPVFDDHGLWSHKNARFSRYGSLTKTLISLINSSSSGMEINALQETLGVYVSPVLTNLFHQDKLYREKIGTRFVYFGKEEKTCQAQLNKRRSKIEIIEPCSLPEPKLIIAVLVELIQKVEFHPKQLIRRLSAKGVKIKSAEIEAIFQHYQLRQKKND
jgi:hypothetical protein